MSENVRKMFSDISSKYDLMNDILSFGIHRIWKKKFIKLLNLDKSSSVLDLASGTGDIAFEEYKYSGKVIGSDFCEDMLSVARKRAAEKNININFVQADAMALPFDDDEFNAATISFGIRNVDNVSKCLTEMARVVKSGGKAAILEFGQPKGIFGSFYKFYSKRIMPLLGKIFAGDSSSYTYLPETAAKFPSGDKFLNIMKNTGSFTQVKYIKLTGGIAYIYLGEVK